MRTKVGLVVGALPIFKAVLAVKLKMAVKIGKMPIRSDNLSIDFDFLVIP